MFYLRGRLICVLLVLLAGACAPAPQSGGSPESVRLVDLFAEATVEGTPAGVGEIEPTQWLFAEGAEAWQAAGSAQGVSVSEGALIGTSVGPSSVLHTAWQAGPGQAGDHIHSVEVRLRASGGGRMSLGTSNSEELVVGPFLAPDNPFGFSMTTPIVPGEETTLYTLRPVRPVPAGAIRHLLLKPVDAPDADFAIESVRVIFENEYLQSVPSGVNWQGLSGAFRETLVSRAPEVLSFELDLPSDAFLDAAVGTLESGPVSFHVSATPVAGGEGLAVRRTVTTAQRWQDLAVSLADFAGQRVRLDLQVEAARPGVVGLWGAPVVRSRVQGLDDRPQAVIAILMDTLRRDHLDMYGHDRETAPQLSALASEGVLVEDPISQATWTKVSVPSIFTSLYPTSHTVADLPDQLPASAHTMAEVFREAGYATVGLSAIPFTGKMTNLHQGYETFWERNPDLVAQGGLADKAARPYVDTLLPWIEAHRDVPFFAFLHVEDPHSPYYSPPAYAGLWGEPGAPEKYAELQDQARPEIDHPLMRQFGMPRRDDLEDAGIDAEAYVDMELDAYDELIRSLDDEIGRLVERLEQLGLRDKVLLAFVTDHGTEFLDHGNHFHGQTVYGELNRVPMFFWGPGFVPPGVRVPGTVENVDYMPTVLEIAGLETPESAHGQSLVPWFAADGSEAAAADAGWRRKPAITEKAPLAFRGPDGFGSLSIISEGWKLIRNDETRPPHVPELELYDHAEDPLNKNDVADANPDVVQRLEAQLDNWLQFAEGAMLTSDADLASEMSPEELERLRALGYL
jgi:arylsulfatase A-like enzyme